MRARCLAALAASALLFSIGPIQAADGVYETPEQAAADPDFALQGEYLGDGTAVQIVALGSGQFNSVTYRGGLPGAGWDGSERLDEELDAAGVRRLIDDLKLKKTERRSPTLGAKPPLGAVVLFDGTAESVAQHWQPGTQTDGELLRQGSTSRDAFQDFSFHAEFRLPFMPAAREQRRGNSGIYYQSRYETQILDSFGLEGTDHECGGFYEIKSPDLNMCLPPLSWQTYDVEFTAARFDAAGKKTANARITARLNGVVIHNDFELPRATLASPLMEGPEAGPIYLQEHGSPVRYRNIWVVPRSAEQEARRPIVPGFERFHGLAGGSAAGGRLLLGELNCTSCHQADAALTKFVLPRKAPILDEVGRRVQADWLLKFLADPHAAKPGTAMPHVLASLPDAQREAAALALTNFLVSTAEPPVVPGDSQAARNGEKLYHEIGCTACHAPRREGQKVSAETTVPLGDLGQKYTIGSLAAFLQDPHKVRPSGRMPAFNLDGNAWRDLACYLAGDSITAPKNPNLRFAAYEGNWPKVPDFDQLKPTKSGLSAGLDLNMAGRTDNFGMRFEGYFITKGAGDYTFHLGSDDGSLLFIDGRKVADSDGVHPHTWSAGKVTLTKGAHVVRVDYIQGGGEWTLNLEVEGPKMPRQDAGRLLALTEAGNPPPPPPPAGTKPPFQFDPEQATKGHELFASLGCANCHEFKENNQPLASKLQAKPLRELNATRGCLAIEIGPAASPLDAAPPRYDLNATQRAALTAALTEPLPGNAPTPTEQISQTFAAFNCSACHVRGGQGGPERDRNALFLSAIPEMGDEGRVPPALDGVGDKLNDDWLRHILQNGASDRPYMLARMPRFGLQNVGHLVEAFVAADRQMSAPPVTPTEPENRVKAVGRRLVGDKALGCIKCHTFGQHRASGIQALNLQTMTRRLREDWFLRYMFNPQIYRPGTRMPTGFPNGQATVRDVYNGDPTQQLAAVWTYLKDGDRAGIPEGLIADVIELKPEKQPILFRNFIDGLPRAIAVGYPEQTHLAWDANQFALAFVWQGRFIDAGLHWQGRGVGFQRPLGDNIVRLEETAPLAVLDSLESEWPKQPVKERGYKFLGYQLDHDGRPHFRYSTEQFSVEDFCQPIAGENAHGFKRTLTLTAPAGKDVKNVYFRVPGKKIERQADGAFLLNDSIRIRLSGGTPSVRQTGDSFELLIPLSFVDGKAEVVEEIQW